MSIVTMHNYASRRIQWLLWKLKKAHDANTADSASRHVAGQIVQTWKQFFAQKDSLNESVPVSEMLLLKCVHNEEVRTAQHTLIALFVKCRSCVRLSGR